MSVPFWLIWLHFGNGHGLKSPYFNDVFYWLDGRFYTWSGWFGAQLQSFEWMRPPAGARRTINGREYRIFSTSRCWLVVRCSWSLVGLPDGIDDANARLRELQTELVRGTP